jgi:hypothetical protein
LEVRFFELSVKIAGKLFAAVLKWSGGKPSSVALKIANTAGTLKCRNWKAEPLEFQSLKCRGAVKLGGTPEQND